MECTFQSVHAYVQTDRLQKIFILLIVHITDTYSTYCLSYTSCAYIHEFNSECSPVNTACWQQDPHTRPDFATVLAKLQELQSSKFASIELEAFTTLQQSWKEEVRLKFEEFKKKEEVSD